MALGAVTGVWGQTPSTPRIQPTGTMTPTSPAPAPTETPLTVNLETLIESLTWGRDRVQGTAPPGTLIEVLLDGEIAATTLTDGRGTWRADLVFETSGSHEFGVQGRDVAGQIVGSFGPMTIIVPEAVLGGSTSRATPTPETVDLQPLLEAVSAMVPPVMQPLPTTSPENPTAVPSPEATAVATATMTVTTSLTLTLTPTMTPVMTLSTTPPATAAVAVTPTVAIVASATPTAMIAPSATPQATATVTPMPTPTLSATPSPTAAIPATPTATATAVAGASAAPTKPVRVPTSTYAERSFPSRPRGTARPAAPAAPPADWRVTLLSPEEMDSGNGRRTFAWEADFRLPPDWAFELVLWKPNQDPLTTGFGLAAPTRNTSISVDLNELDHTLGNLLQPGLYEWGVLLVQVSPYQRLAFLGDAHRFRFDRTYGQSVDPLHRESVGSQTNEETIVTSCVDPAAGRVGPASHPAPVADHRTPWFDGRHWGMDAATVHAPSRGRHERHHS